MENGGGISRELGRIEATLNSIHETLGAMRVDLKDHKEKVDDSLKEYEKRINVLEQYRWYLVGIATLIPFVVKYLL